MHLPSKIWGQGVSSAHYGERIFYTTTIVHTPRSANNAAKKLATFALTLVPTVWFSIAPIWLKHNLEQDNILRDKFLFILLVRTLNGEGTATPPTG
ncbi:hypothetical protein IFM89_003108 [Coptis chinensis]|uniref:Uncharacterized protein n=1 Tax=Coptis chinensis TaxID=261450 RepID=A0A835IWE2_9MAGN|nr:hypothetical protein IFM89_003108 [Coptis chinensis]